MDSSASCLGLIIWVGCAAVVAQQAQKRGYSLMLGFMGGMFLGIFGLVIVFMLPDRQVQFPKFDNHPIYTPEQLPRPQVQPPPANPVPAQHIYIHTTPAPVPQPPPQTSSPAAMIPKLPARCESCGQPLSMDSVKWAGPLSARCPSCGAAVEVKWDKIGAS